MTAETKNRIKYAVETVESGRALINEAWNYCTESQGLDNSEKADVMKTLIKAYDAWCKRCALTSSKAIKF